MDESRVQLNLHYHPAVVARVHVAAYQESDDRGAESTRLVDTEVESLAAAKQLTQVTDDGLEAAAQQLLALGVERFHLTRYTPRACCRPSCMWAASWRHPADGGMVSIQNAATASGALRNAAAAERKRQEQAAIREADQHLRRALACLENAGLAADADKLRALL